MPPSKKVESSSSEDEPIKKYTKKVESSSSEDEPIKKPTKKVESSSSEDEPTKKVESSSDENKHTKPTLTPDIFYRRGTIGDFSWMIWQEKYSKDLFIFNDNVEDMRSGPRGLTSGNAIIRPYKAENPPRAWGIPTGSNGKGFKTLNTFAKDAIDESIEIIRELIKKNYYRRLHYSAEKDGTIGTSIFKVAPVVLDYILEQLTLLCD